MLTALEVLIISFNFHYNLQVGNIIISFLQV